MLKQRRSRLPGAPVIKSTSYSLMMMITVVGLVVVIIVEVNIMESWQVSQYEEILKKAEARAVDYPGNQDMVDWVLVENDAKWRLHV